MTKVNHHQTTMNVKVEELFKVRSGDFHAVSELDLGSVPLISCGDTNNGLVGHFDIPKKHTYKDSITVAYNGSWPLLAKYHPYKFGAKDDVAVLIPLAPMKETTLLYIATLFNRMTWRHSYGRKCFKQKLEKVTLAVPVTKDEKGVHLDEDYIFGVYPKSCHDFIPPEKTEPHFEFPPLTWESFNIKTLFDYEVGDFHSLSQLDSGEYMTVSRVTEDNGVVGFFDLPDNARVFRKGCLTVSTLGGDAYVQMDKFIATDNVIVCTPKKNLRITTLFFVAFMLNQQKWRYGYERQCYQAKFGRTNIYLPVTTSNQLDEDVMESILRHTPYWHQIERRFQEEILLTSLFLSGQQGKQAEQLTLFTTAGG